MAVNLFEEIVRSAFQAAGYLTVENVPYRRYANARSVAGNPVAAAVSSDIDLIAIAPHRRDHRRVLAISCKGGRHGLVLPGACDSIVGTTNAVIAGSPAATGFRELVDDDWAAGFRATVHRIAGESVFTHVTVALTVSGDRRAWTGNTRFARLTPHLCVYDVGELLRMIDKNEQRLFPNGTAAKLRHLASAVSSRG